ncbi:MAG: NADH-quinone oxidoreductase subunit B [Planctomycetes bacterium]|jgi:NADH-quinone oxidoreductase subunit B|nr:NADH-quinone oxidoreductase subunit B [Planctomycetota bacterium]HJO26673.1 NADH-quinone oxidoreductase subunit NuoB [Planctomycetota bacterium]
MGSLTPVSGDLASGGFEDAGARGGFFTTQADALVNWGRKNSLWPMPLGLSCCGIEMMAMFGPAFDIARFGAEAARFTPRQCDVMIVAGTLTWKMAEAARTIYDQMPDPKWVIAMGVCSSTGGMYDTYSVVQGVDMLLPVDVYVPGCPPRPDAVIDALMKLQKRVEREQPVRRLMANFGQTATREDTGTGAFQMPPNRANPTRRMGEVLDAESNRRAERP